MEMLVQLALLAVGFVLLVKGADWFVDGASEIAAKLKIPPLIIGLTIVAMGTSAPEAAVSISAALKGSAEITIERSVRGRRQAEDHHHSDLASQACRADCRSCRRKFPSPAHRPSAGEGETRLGIWRPGRHHEVAPRP